MTKDELSKLIKIKNEIEQIKHELENVELEYVTDAVKGSSKEFPFVAHSIMISGYDDKSYSNKVRRIENRLKNKLGELIQEKDRLTEYIYNLSDSDLRRILTYRYVNGLTWQEIGTNMNYSFETVRKKHDNYIKSIPLNTTFEVVK